MKIVDYVLCIGDYREELPRLPISATVSVWQVPSGYRPSGYFISVWEGGEKPREIPACAAADVNFLGELQLPPHPDAQLAAAKKSCRAIVISACENELNALVCDYPVGEVLTWPQQVREAGEVLAGERVSQQPLLTSIALHSGGISVDITTVARNVIAKANVYSERAGEIIGRRHAIVSRINAAQKVEEAFCAARQNENRNFNQGKEL